MKKIFVTGGGGYVGAVLIPKLLDENYEVTVLDLFIYGENVLQTHKNLKKIKGDIRDQVLLKECIKGSDIVIHLACISNDPSFELNPQLGKTINLDSFEPLVEISLKNNVKRFIYASSSSVYGVKKETDVTEDKSLEPLTDYSKYKVECEKILHKYASDNFSPITIRPATVCGFSPRQRLDVVVNILTNLAFHKRNITVFGGEQLRPNIHIYDMVDAYLALISANKNLVHNEIFNAGFENQKVINIAKIVKENVGLDVKIDIEESNDDRSYHISSKKIKNILNFEPKKTIDDAVKELIHAFEKKILVNTFNDDGFFNIKRMQNINMK